MPYELEVAQLIDMGFDDTLSSQSALIKTNGKVDAAIELLLADSSITGKKFAGSKELCSAKSGRCNEIPHSTEDKPTAKHLASIFTQNLAPRPQQSQLAPSGKSRNSSTLSRQVSTSLSSSRVQSPAFKLSPNARRDNGFAGLKRSYSMIGESNTDRTLDDDSLHRLSPHCDNSQQINTAKREPLQGHSEKMSSSPSVAIRQPLADRLRPSVFEEFEGQKIVKELLQELHGAGRIPSLILWGPPGCGKTTLARLIGRTQGYEFVPLSAVSCGVAEIKQAMVKPGAVSCGEVSSKRIMLFVDEIHRLNKLQQDVFLPAIEVGDVALVGATTENPSFSLNKALVSRCRVLTLEKLTIAQISRLLLTALRDPVRGVRASLIPRRTSDESHSFNSQRLDSYVSTDFPRAGLQSESSSFAHQGALSCGTTTQSPEIHSGRGVPKSRDSADSAGDEDWADLGLTGNDSEASGCGGQAGEMHNRTDGPDICVEEGLVEALADAADGDARIALNALEIAVFLAAAAACESSDPSRKAPGYDTTPCMSTARRSTRALSEGLDHPMGFQRANLSSVLQSADAAAGSSGVALSDNVYTTNPNELYETVPLTTSPASVNKPGSSLDLVAAIRIVECKSHDRAEEWSTRRIMVTMEHARRGLQKGFLKYDKSGDEHYNTVSALHKSIRGSDPQATVYWLARMLEGGEDPVFIARRLVRAATEDIGLADPQALTQAMAGLQACQAVGMPECSVILAQVAIYLALSPKSTAVYKAYLAAQKCVQSEPSYPVPLHLRNGTTGLLRNLGWGHGYKYNPDLPEDETRDQEYLPEPLRHRVFFEFSLRQMQDSSSPAF